MCLHVPVLSSQDAPGSPVLPPGSPGSPGGSGSSSHGPIVKSVGCGLYSSAVVTFDGEVYQVRRTIKTESEIRGERDQRETSITLVVL